MMSNLSSFVNKHRRSVLFVFLFLVISLLFNFQFIGEIVRNPSNVTHGEDTVLVSYFAERAYQKILHFENPFQFNDVILYPFGSNTVLGETGIIHAFYFLLFRPFLHPYASLLLVVVLNLFFCQLAMYLLLRYLKIDRLISFLFANVFAFAPFVSVRIQYHYNYVYHFLFPLITYLLLLVLQSTKKSTKLFASLFLGISVSLLFYNTLYYVFMYILFIGIFSICYTAVNRKQIQSIVQKIVSRLPYLFLSCIVALIILSPFFVELFQVLKMNEVKETAGWGGAIEFSANAADLFFPSEFNPFVGSISSKIRAHMPDKQPVEQIIYPGVLVLAGTAIFIYSKRKKWWDPMLLTGLSFYILSLGPFLHIFKYWNIRINESILGVIPLPYVILHKIPFLSMMRSPVRFSVMISFAFVIVAAYGFQTLLKQFPKRKWIAILLFTVFLLDQYYVLQIKPIKTHVPFKSYALIQSDPEAGAVMEIPFVIQDGFFYWGKVFHAFPMLGQLIHGKPVIGGYIARVPDSYFSYYMQDPFLSYFGIIADDKRQEQKVPFTKPPDNSLEESADFLGIKYVLVREDLPKYKRIAQDLKQIGFKNIISNDDGFSTFVRKPKLRSTISINILDKENENIFGGWSYPEKEFRWIDGATAGLLIKKEDSSMKVMKVSIFSYVVPRKVEVFVNRTFIQTLAVDPKVQTFELPLNTLVKGLNRVEFKVKGNKNVSPPGDARKLSIAFTNIVLQ